MNVPAIDAYATHDELDGVPQPFVTPQLFGHREVFAEMVEAARSGRMHHAWLMQGPAGIGKATAAFAMARLLGGAATIGDGDATIGFEEKTQQQQQTKNLVVLGQDSGTRFLVSTLER